MNKYEKFTKLADLVIEMAELIKDTTFADWFMYRNGMTQFIDKDYAMVKDALFPQVYNPVYNPPVAPPSPFRYVYGYGQQQPWSSAWAPGSPVTQQRDIFDSIGATKLNDAMKKEEDDLDDATKFIEFSAGFLPKGHLDINMPLMGDIVEAVREKNYEKAAQLVKDHWVEGIEENQVPPKNTYIPFGGTSDPTIPSWPSAYDEETSEEEPVEDDITD